MFEKKLTVYVAEDDPLSGKMMNITVKRIGFEFVGLATDTDTCIAEVADIKPDIILMDIDMPGSVDGIGAADIITKKHNIPVIFVTANSEDSVFERALKTSPFGYILKPVTRDILRTVVHMGYSRHLLELEIQEKQRQLSKLNDELEQKVLDRTQEIDEKNKQLEIALVKEKEMNEFQARIVTTISHEFRTPMTTIMSSADIMEMLINKEKPKEKIFRHTQLIKTSVNELIELLNGVLITEKMDSGKYEVIKESIDLNDYFKQLLFKTQIGIGKNHQITTNIDTNLENTSTDKKLFSQITNNILSNAFKYSEENTEIIISAKTTNISLIFSVEDHGIGMDKDT
ncbi:MAG: response regulator, partial [Bacteroidales bacterium]|nr:response regulator [Bacteroidales bacterium]